MGVNYIILFRISLKKLISHKNLSFGTEIFVIIEKKIQYPYEIRT